MGIRETLNQHPSIATVAAAVLILGAGVYLLAFMRQEAAPRYGSVAYYTDDDGKTYFEDDIRKIAPFDHKGKQAYRAHVYTCDGGKTKWVAYMEGYAPEVRQKVAEIMEYQRQAEADPNRQPPPDKDPIYVMPEFNRLGLMYKKPDKPGQPPNRWVKASDGAAYEEAQKVVCPHGDLQHRIEIVLP